MDSRRQWPKRRPLALNNSHRQPPELPPYLNMPPAATATRDVVNPYAKPAQNAADMGRQSQHRVSNQHKRKYKLAQATRKPKAGDQLTLDNKVAFAPEQDCKICKARHIRKFILPTYTIPKRAHHPNCSLNKTTHGLGELTVQSIANMEDNKRFKALTAPIRPEERFSGKHATSANAAAFFQPKEIPKIPKTMTVVRTRMANSYQTRRPSRHLVM